MADGFDVTEFTKFEKDLLAIANEKMPKESRKFLKQQGTKLNKKNKDSYNSMGIGEETGLTKKSFKSGKVYKYNGALSVRAYNNALVKSKDGKKTYPLGAMLNKGFRHVNKDGSESWVPGYRFMEKAKSNFEPEYYENTQEFINEVLEKGL